MSLHNAEAYWNGNLENGKGTIKLPKCQVECSYGASSRFEDGPGTSPEELIAGAHAGCFSMALAHALTQAGHVPSQVHTIANISLEKVGNGFEIKRINLVTKAHVTDIELSEFMKIAETTQKECPVSKALQAVDIRLDAELAAEK